jgi:restriction system protein
MAIPDYQSIMLPLLQLASDSQVHRYRAAVESLADHFNLAPEERPELLPSGKQPTFDNRVGWARTYMTKAGLLSSPNRGLFQITDRGKEVLHESPPEINVAFLKKFREFIEFRNLRRDEPETEAASASSSTFDETTPEETLETDLGNKIMDTVKVARQPSSRNSLSILL